MTDEPRVAIVTTVRNPGPSFRSFLRHHLGAGFSRIYVFFDDPADPTIDGLAPDPRVEVLRCDEALRSHWVRWPQMLGAVGTEVMARQVLNAELALGLARNEELDWLLHIDADEAWYAEGRSAPQAFGQLGPEIDTVTFLNLEAIPSTAHVEDFFYEVTLFKRNPRALDDAQRQRVKAEPRFASGYFLYYSNGKSAVRVQEGLLPAGVHGFTRPGRPLRRQVVESPAIIHYINAGFENFWRRYRTWGNFGDRWFDRIDIARAIGDFHIRARDVVAAGDRDAALDFYSEHVVLEDDAEAQRLVSAGFCRSIVDIARKVDDEHSGIRHASQCGTE